MECLALFWPVEQKTEILYILVIVAVTWLGILAATRGLQVLAGRSGDPLLAAKAIRTFVRWLGLIIGAGLILSRFQIDLWGFITGVLALIAVGFVAMWSVVNHAFCAFLMILFKMFAVGDEIELPNETVKGEIVDLTLFFTVLRAEDGRLIQIPNNLFFQKIVIRRKGSTRTELKEQLGRETPAG